MGKNCEFRRQLEFPNAVVLNAVARRNTQMSANASPQKSAKNPKGRKRAQKSIKLQTTRFETTRFGNSQKKSSFPEDLGSQEFPQNNEIILNHPAAKGGRQKGIGKKVTKNVKKGDKMVIKRWPKQKKWPIHFCFPPFAAQWLKDLFCYICLSGGGVVSPAKTYNIGLS